MHVRFTVTGAGTVKNVKVVKSSDQVFETATVRAVEQWKYQPQMDEGKPVERDGIENDRPLRPRQLRGRRLAGIATCGLRPTLISTLLSLLLVGAPAALAQDRTARPTAKRAGAAAEPAEEAREAEAGSRGSRPEAEPPRGRAEAGQRTEAEEPRGEEGRREPKKRLLYPISKRVSRYLAASLKLMQENKLDDAKALLEKIGGSRRLNPAERAKIEQFLGNVAIYKSDMPGGAKHLSQALSSSGLDLGLRAAGDLPAREPVRADRGLPQGDADPRPLVRGGRGADARGLLPEGRDPDPDAAARGGGRGRRAGGEP